MFEGCAEEAMKFYVGLIPGSKIHSAEHYAEGPSKGKLKLASFSLGGAEFLCIDSPAKHQFGFTPAMSIFVDCATVDELDHLYATLADRGQVFMPLANYGFSTKFGWVGDRFGVSWQLNLR